MHLDLVPQHTATGEPFFRPYLHPLTQTLAHLRFGFERSTVAAECATVFEAVDASGVGGSFAGTVVDWRLEMLTSAFFHPLLFRHSNFTAAGLRKFLVLGVAVGIVGRVAALYAPESTLNVVADGGGLNYGAMFAPNWGLVMYTPSIAPALPFIFRRQ